MGNKVHRALNRYRVVIEKIYRLYQKYELAQFNLEAGKSYLVAAVNTGMPHGSDIGRPTEKRALRTMDLENRSLDLYNELSELVNEKEQFDEQMKSVLSPIELKLVRHKTIFNYTFAELASKQGMKTATVKTQYFRALRKMEIIFNHKCV